MITLEPYRDLAKMQNWKKIIASLLGFTVLSSFSIGFMCYKAAFLPWLTTVRHARRSIPGNTDLEHCDDPTDNLFRLNYLEITPKPPLVGRNVTIWAFGRFKSDISKNATIWVFGNNNDGGVAIWGGLEFCNVTTNFQTIDEILRPVCPPVRGSAYLKSEFYIESGTPRGEWFVRIDGRDGNDGQADDPRLFCVEGYIDVRRSNEDIRPPNPPRDLR